MTRILRAVFAASLLLTALPASALAQGRPLQQVLDLNRQAMEAYNNLEIEQAQGLLQQALDAATRGHVTGSPLARTYVNLGIVAIAGLGDNGAGLNYFVSALQADGSVALDPLLSTPDIELIWTQARSRAGSGGGGGPVQIEPPPDTSGGGGGPVGDLVHQPVPEQLRSTPVPVYVEVPGHPAHVYLYYRGHGMRDFERAEMEHVSRGWGYEIPCGDVFEPEVNYYIAVFDSSGSPISFAGSQSSPISVPIVATRSTSAPALPGRAPPTQCTQMEEECPPDLPGCHSGGGTRALGDSCHSNAECQSGNCQDDLCALSDDGGGGGGGGDDGSNGAPRFFTRVSVGAGLSYVSSGLPTDRNVCDEGALEGDVGDCGAVDNPQPLPTDTFRRFTTVEQAGMNPGDGGGPGYSQLYGYDDTGIRGNPDNGLGVGLNPDESQTCPFTDRHCFYVESPGFVANLSLRLDIGYYIVPRWFAVAAMFRFQPISGSGTLSFMQLGLRVETELTEPQPTGFHVHLHLGFIAYGQIQVYLPRQGERNAYAPWGASGYQGIDFGSTIGYRFMPNFGIHVQPILIFNFPSFLFTLDLMAGFEVGF